MFKRTLKISINQLIENLAVPIPNLILAKLVTQSATNADNYTEVIASWNFIDRIYALVVCACNGLNQGFLSATFYALRCNRMNHLLHLFLFTILLGTSLSTLVCIIIQLIPKQIALLYGKSERFLMFFFLFVVM